MRSRTLNYYSRRGGGRLTRASLLVVGGVAGALWGMVEAWWAQPAIPHPLLSSREWWTTWAVSVVMTGTWGVLLALLLSPLLRRWPLRGPSLLAGLVVGVPLAMDLLLRLRPRLGPGALKESIGLSVAALVLTVVLFAVNPRRRLIRWVLPAGILAAGLATFAGVRSIVPTSRGGGSPAAGVEATGANATMSARPNVLLISLDTTRSDHLWPVPPQLRFLTELAQESVVLTGLSAPIPLTGPSHATLLTGTLPAQSGVLNNGLPLLDTVPTLAERLAHRGYSTGAVISAAVLHHRLCGLERGFAEYDDTFRPGNPVKRLVFVQWAERLGVLVSGKGTGLNRKRRASETVEVGLRYLARHRDEPQFLWLHFYDPHIPYDPVSELPEDAELVAIAGEPSRAADEGYWRQRERYAAEIRDVDIALGELWSGLEELGLKDRTLVVLVTDHGESFGTHGRGYRFNHGAYIFEDEIRLGGFWRDPARSGSGSESAIAATSEGGPSPAATATGPIEEPAPLSLDRLHDAIVDRVEGESPDWRAGNGSVSFFHSTIAGDTLWTGLRSGDRKLVRGRAMSEVEYFEAYDLATDPGERANLLPDRRPPSQCAADTRGEPLDPAWLRLEELLDEYAAAVLTSLTDVRSQSPEAIEVLRSLGYVD